MTGFITTALMGFFVLSGAGGKIAVADTAVPLIEEPAYPTYSVSMTGYNAVPEQTDSDPYTTASGAYSNPDIVAARSADLAAALPFGTVIEVVAHNGMKSPNCGFAAVEQYMGLRVIADAMHPRKKNQIDILFHNEPNVRAQGRKVNPAVALGVCKEIEIRVVGKIDVKRMPRTQDELRLAIGILDRADEAQLAISK